VAQTPALVAAIAMDSLSRRLAAASEPQCELLGDWGSFGWWLQGFLAVISFSSLIGKRFTDKVRRPWTVWFFDTSKQVMQCLLVHLLNIGLAAGLNNWLELDIDACSWYWVNLTLDCTLGVLVVFLLLRLLQLVYRSRCSGRPELARCGEYGAPPSWRIFARQLSDWLAICLAEKVLLAGFTVWLGTTLAGVAKVSLGWLDAYPRLKLFVVMVLTPLVLNIFALWTADNFLQADAKEEGCQLVRAKGEAVEWHVRAAMTKLSASPPGSDFEGLHLPTFSEWKQQQVQSTTPAAAKFGYVFGCV